MSLEGLRSSQMGGSALAIFVSLESDIPVSTPASLDYLGWLKDIALSIIDDLPPFLSFAASPFRDYCTATEAFIECIRSKTEGEIPSPEATACFIYW